MEIRLLGQIAAIGRAPITLGGPTQRRVLAALALRRNEVVSVPYLISVIWPGDDPPARADHNVRTYVHRLRAALAESSDRLETVGAGYRLSVATEELDVARFERLAGTAGRLGDTGQTVASLDLIDEAVGLWSGGPLQEFEHEDWARPDVVRLRELNQELRARRAEALLQLGRASDAIEPMRSLIRDEPLRERPRALLMRALYESGRQPEALRSFQEFRQVLVDEIGVEPSGELVELDRQIATSALIAGRDQRPEIGGYELHDQIGEGAFAVVHRATQIALDRQVAVKIIRADLANQPEFIRRFEAEAQMVARIEHPSVVPLYDYWRQPDRAFLVMRLMTGGSLETHLDRPWPLEATLDLVDQIGSALGAAHEAHIVHRDVKPGNILFDGDGRAYLSDFGIALDADALAQPESTPSDGSPVFASPEQLRREPAGPEADVYALAIVAFTLLAGRTPFADAADQQALLRRQLDDPIPALQSIRSEVPRGLDDVLAIATAKRPTDRYPTAPSFALALRAASLSSGDPAPATARAVGPSTNPYKGLQAFDETDASDFFGRDRLVDELLTRLERPGHHLMAIVGPSGSGKSSVVRAGLIPALRSGRVSGSSEWFVTTMVPGSHPFEALETALLRVSVNPPIALLDQLRDGDRGLLRAVRRVLPDDGAVVAIVIDQFEELFTGATLDDERDQFLRAVTVAATTADSPVRFAITLRADFYDRPLRHPEFAPLLKENSVVVTPLAPDELERAIVSPAEAAGVGFEPGLVAEIIADVNHEPGALPLLQYALTQAFDQNSENKITINAYRSIGGLAGALGRRAEELWLDVNQDQRLAARRLFGRLVSLGEGTEDTRRRARLAEVGADAATQAVVDRFGQARLLTFDRDPATRDATVEIAHEALIREWPRLREWLDEDRDMLRTHRHLTQAASSWVDRGRDPNELYRGARLDTAAPMLTGAPGAPHTSVQVAHAPNHLTLNDTESSFLAASVERRDTEAEAERRRVRRLRRLAAATGLVALVALVAGSMALVQWRRADDQAELANSNAEQAAASAELADQRATEAQQATARGDLERLRAVALAGAEESPSLSALLALESHRLDPATESLDVLHRVLTESPGFLGSIAGGPYVGTELFDDGVTLAAATPSSIEVWDLRTRTLVGSLAHDSLSGRAWVKQIDRDRIAAVSSDRTQTMLHDVVGEAGPAVLTHASLVNDIAISPDGSQLAAGLEGGTIEIWGLSTGELLDSFDTGTPDLVFTRWSPAGDLLAAINLSSQVQMWDVDELSLLWSTEAKEGAIVNQVRPSAFSFSPSGDRFVLAAGSLDGGLLTFSSSDGSEVAPPIPTLGTRGFIRDEIYWTGPDTLGIPTGGNILAFDLASGSATTPAIEGFKQTARSVKYSAELDQFAIAGRSGLEFWSANGSGPLERVIPLAPEHQAAVAATDGSILTSLAADGSQLLVSVFSIPPTAALAYDLTTSPASRSALTSEGSVTLGYGEYTLFGENFAVQILDSELAALGPPVPMPFDFSEVGVSEDGRFIGFGRLGGHVDVYRNTGELLGTVSLGDPAEFAGAQTAPWFTSDGKYMAVTTVGRRSGLWSTDPLERIDLPPEFEEGWVHGLGPWLFVEGEDGTAQRLDPSTMTAVGGPISLNGIGSLGYPKIDETNMRFAANNGELVKVFDLATGRQMGRELPHSANIASRMEFSADGNLLSVPTDDRITLWNYDTDTWTGIACEFAGRNMTREEWDQFGPRTIEYRATCPQYGLP